MNLEKRADATSGPEPTAGEPGAAPEAEALRAGKVPEAAPRRARRLPALSMSGLPIVLATVLLFLVSPLIVGGSSSWTAVLGMLPFAAILAVASTGQTLVVQQRGFDLSVPGMIALAAVIVTKYPNGDESKVVPAILIVIAVAIGVGIVNGLAVTTLGISPIIVTLAMNNLLLGAVLEVSGGNTTRATGKLSSLAVDKFLGVPNTVWVAVIVCVLAWLLATRTVFGRRFEAIGNNARAAAIVGLGVQRYRIGTYAAASVLYGIAGVMLAGFLESPGLFAGDIYLFSTVTAVVIAGTPLRGGKANLLAVGVAALFLSQLESVVLSVASQDAWRYVVQGAVIGVGMAAQGLLRVSYFKNLLSARRRRPGAPPGEPTGDPAGETTVGRLEDAR